MSYRALIKHHNCFLYASQPVGQGYKTLLFDIYHEDHRLVKGFTWRCQAADKGHFSLELQDLGLSLQQQVFDIKCKIWIYRDVVYFMWRDVPKGQSISFSFEPDATDSFEARGFPPPLTRRFEYSQDAKAASWVYRGQDGFDRFAQIECKTQMHINAEKSFTVLPDDKGEVAVVMRFARTKSGQSAQFPVVDLASYAQLQKECADFKTHFGDLAATTDPWLAQGMTDLFILKGVTEGQACIHAGTPWFSCLFGRDSLITAEQCLQVAPEIARMALTALSACQAKDFDVFQDAEPGKIAHEIRSNERNNLKHMPFGRYYAGIDTTLLFISLAAAYLRVTRDEEFIRRISSQIEAATRWMMRRLDQEKFITYRANKEKNGEGEYGLAEKGWKDGAPVVHRDGGQAPHPIALCEVQGYAYRALHDSAQMAVISIDKEALLRRAQKLKADFDQAFWCADIGTYAMALDGNQQPCKIVTTNPGHLLRTGIIDDVAKIKAVAKTFADPQQLFSGWGLRTLSMQDKSFDPSSYQLGGVWPHDTLECLRGLWAVGEKETALKLAQALADLAQKFQGRLPELIAGNPRQGDEVVAYFKGCSPQAWSASIPFALPVAVQKDKK